MSSRAEKIDSIILKRKEKGLRLGNDRNWFHQVRESLAGLRTEIEVNAPSFAADAQEKVTDIRARLLSVESRISSDIAAIDKVKNHFDKDVLSVAVVGQMGMGKSTFLQSLTGLQDSQIPAQRGNACTATQSIIRHDDSAVGYADVHFRTRQSLLNLILGYYGQLQWSTSSIGTFADFKRDFDRQDVPEKSTSEYDVYQLLKAYRASIDEFDRTIFSTGSTSRRIGLDDVAKYVTYNDGQARVESLAVEYVEVFCKFPCEDVGKIALVDTPGMNATSEARDKKILFKVLNDDADFVLFVGIPTERGVTGKDQEIFRNCEDCIRQVSNTGLKERSFYIANQAIVKDSSGVIVRNGSDAGFNHLWQAYFDAGRLPAERLIRVDVKNDAAVRDNVLDPLVDYLVSKLSDMDDAEMVAVAARIEEMKAEILRLVQFVCTDLRVKSGADNDTYRKLVQCFDRFFPSFSGMLQSFVDRYRPKETDDDSPSDNPFTQKVSDIYREFQDKIGEDLTEERVQTEMHSAAGQGGAAFFNLLSYLRCSVRDRFCGLEDACRDMVDSAKDRLARIMMDPMPGGGGLEKVDLLHDTNGNVLSGGAFFGAMARIARTATGDTQCRELARQLQAFADFKLLFSGFIEHRIAMSLDPLRQEAYDKYYQSRIDFNSATSIRTALLALCDAAVNNVAISLVEQSGTAPSQAIYAVLENFVDRTLRKRGMEKEWCDFYETVRSQVWPEVFDPNSAGNRMITQLRERVDALTALSR